MEPVSAGVFSLHFRLAFRYEPPVTFARSLSTLCSQSPGHNVLTSIVTSIVGDSSNRVYILFNCSMSNKCMYAQVYGTKQSGGVWRRRHFRGNSSKALATPGAFERCKMLYSK